MNDDLENLQHQIDNLAMSLAQLTSRLSDTENNFDAQIQDARNDAEREATDIRNALSTLEHKVDFP